MYKGKCSNCNIDYDRKTKPNKINFCGASCSNKWQYKNGIRDAKAITKKANQTLRERGQYTRDNTYLKGANNHSWVGGRNITNKGYVRIRKNNTYVLEHRYVWEQANGEIPEGFQLHHKDRNKQNNKLSNLQLLSNSDHQKLHPQPRDTSTGKFTER